MKEQRSLKNFITEALVTVNKCHSDSWSEDELEQLATETVSKWKSSLAAQESEGGE